MKSLCILVSATTLLVGCGSFSGPSSHRAALEAPADVPPALQPSAALEPYLSYPATGVQIYECVAKPDSPAGYAWQFRAPEAQLADGSGHTVIHHGAGPSWTADDESSVTARVAATAPAPREGAIPWLMLDVGAHRGHGLLEPATAVQRLKTTGGIAPTLPCNAQAVGQVSRVPYSATYVFWRPRGN